MKLLLLVPSLILVSGALVLFSFAPFDPLYRLVMLLLTMGLLCGIPFLASLWSNGARGKVRIAMSTPLRFVSLARTWFYPIVGALLITLSGAVMVWAMLAPGVEPISFVVGGRGASWALLITGGAALAYLLKKFRIPRGLELSQDGLRWWRGADEISLPWGQIAEVNLGAGVEGTAKIAQIHERGGKVHVVAPLLVGSDPRIVAEVIRYFLKNPESRVTLDNPSAALALVTESL